MHTHRAITRALSLSLFCSFLFSTWLGISMNHLVGLLVHTRRLKDGKIRCLPGPWFSTWEPRKDKLDFLIRRQHHRGWVLRSLEFQREILRLLVLGPEEVAWVEGLRKTEWGKGAMIVCREKSVSAMLFFAKDEANNAQYDGEQWKIFSILCITVEDSIPCSRSSCWPMNSPWK